MCDYSPNREAAMTVVERDAGGKPTVWCDPCIEPLIRALNAAGLRTIASCCGHGKRHGRITLADGKELLVFPDYESTTRAEQVLDGLDINGSPMALNPEQAS